MFKNRAVYFGAIYSVLVIIYKLIIILGGYALTKFGFFFSNIISVIAIIPFIFLAIYLTKKEKGGFIGGKQGMHIGLLLTIVAALILSAYNYIEFEWKWKALSVKYYNSEAYKDFLMRNPSIKTEEYSKIIEAAIAELSPFKAITAKLFVLFFFGVSSSFMAAVLLRKRPE